MHHDVLSSRFIARQLQYDCLFLLGLMWHIELRCKQQERSCRYHDGAQIQELVEAQRWAVQAFCRVDMSKLVSIVRDLHRDRQAHTTPSTPIEACCLLVWPLPDAVEAGQHATQQQTCTCVCCW